MNTVVGQDIIKNRLKKQIQENRISHAQLFVGPEGSCKLNMAIHFANQIIKNSKNLEQLSQYTHPDINFIFPNATSNTVKSKASSKDYQNQWREFLKQSTYQTLIDWYNFIEIENKQGRIGVEDAQFLLKNIALKSYEGGYKIVIIWHADKMNTSTANKILKILEEPPEKTLFILTTENEEAILQTILSRVQITRFNKIPIDAITEFLTSHKRTDLETAKKIATLSNGNINLALKYFEKNPYEEFESIFANWIRMAFMAKSKPEALQSLIEMTAEIASWGREKQKKYLSYSLELFRQSLLNNYGVPELNYLTIDVANFNWEKFTNFIHGNNIANILEELNKAYYHIERNANPKLVFLDLSIKTTRYIHAKVE